MASIGTIEYGKWLKHYRENHFSYGAPSYDIWKECYMVTRTSEKQDQAQKKYIRECARHSQEILGNMLIEHKVEYYKRLASWNAFKETSQLNDDTLNEIRKYL